MSAESLAKIGINLDNAPPLDKTIVQNIYKLGEQYDQGSYLSKWYVNRIYQERL